MTRTPQRRTRAESGRDNCQQPRGRPAARAGTETCEADGSSAPSLLPKRRGAAEGRGGGGPQSCRHLPPLPPTARPQRERAAQPPSQPAAAITFPHPLAARPSPAHRGEAAQHGGSLTGRRYTDGTAASSPALGTARPAGAGGAEGGQLQGPSFGELQRTECRSHCFSSIVTNRPR